MAYISSQYFTALAAAASTRTVGLTVPAGCKLLMAFFGRGYHTGINPTVSSITVGGQSCTIIGQAGNEFGAGCAVYRENPLTGSQDLVVTTTLDFTRAHIAVHYLDDDGAVSGAAYTSNYNATTELTVNSAVDSTVYAIAANFETTLQAAPNAGTGETRHSSDTGNSDVAWQSALLSQAGAASVVIGPTWGNPERHIGGISVAPAGGGGATPFLKVLFKPRA